MQFSIDQQLLKDHSGLMVGLIILRGGKNAASPPEIVEALRAAEKKVRNSLDLETYRDHPNIATLREIHRSFGNNPNKFPPSVQALLKRVLKGGDLPSINTLVDLYNVISLEHVISAGAEDIDAMTGDFRLTYAKGDEEFIALGETENTPPAEGEIIYCDDHGVICGKFDWREADRTKVTENSENVVLVLEVCPPVTHDQLQEVLNELEGLVQKHCGGECTQLILEEAHSEGDA